MNRLLRAVHTNQAFTIIEVLVAGSLLLIVMAVMFQLLVPSFSLFRNQMAFSQAHQNALMSSQRVKRELSNTGLSTLTLATDQEGFSFLPKDSTAPFDGAGQTRYSNQFIVYYLNPDRKLIRKNWPSASDTIPAGLFDGPAPPRLSQSQLQQVKTTVNQTERVMALSVSHFSVVDSGGDGLLLEPPLTMKLVCSVETEGDKVQDFEVQLEVSPRSIQW